MVVVVCDRNVVVRVGAGVGATVELLGVTAMSAQFQNSSPKSSELQHDVEQLAQSSAAKSDHARAFQPRAFRFLKYVK